MAPSTPPHRRETSEDVRAVVASPGSRRKACERAIDSPGPKRPCLNSSSDAAEQAAPENNRYGNSDGQPLPALLYFNNPEDIPPLIDAPEYDPWQHESNLHGNRLSSAAGASADADPDPPYAAADLQAVTTPSTANANITVDVLAVWNAATAVIAAGAGAARGLTEELQRVSPPAAAEAAAAGPTSAAAAAAAVNTQHLPADQVCQLLAAAGKAAVSPVAAVEPTADLVTAAVEETTAVPIAAEACAADKAASQQPTAVPVEAAVSTAGQSPVVATAAEPSAPATAASTAGQPVVEQPLEEVTNGLRVELTRTFTADLAGKDILLGKKLGAGAFAVVMHGSAVPAAAAVAASLSGASEPSVLQAAAAGPSAAAAAAGAAAVLTASNAIRMRSATYAVKVFRDRIGTPGSEDYQAWATSIGRLILKRNVATEFLAMEMLQEHSNFAKILAIGKLHLPSSSSASSGQKKQRTLFCAVLEKMMPLEDMMEKWHIPDDLLQRKAGSLVAAVELMHSGRLIHGGQRYRIVHRDMALKNLLISPTTGSICVADFGTAAVIAVGSSSTGGSGISSSSSDSGRCSVEVAAAEGLMSAAIGTPLYMAPEVAKLYELAKGVAADRYQPGQLGLVETQYLMTTAVGTPLYMAPEVAELFEAAKAAAAAAAAAATPWWPPPPPPPPGGGPPAAAATSGSGGSKFGQPVFPELECAFYKKEVDMWSLGVTVIMMFGGGPKSLAGLLEVEEGVQPSEHMWKFVADFVNGVNLIGPMTAKNKQQYAPLREFVDCCCGINRPRMTAAGMMDPASRPVWLPKLES